MKGERVFGEKEKNSPSATKNRFFGREREKKKGCRERDVICRFGLFFKFGLVSFFWSIDKKE